VGEKNRVKHSHGEKTWRQKAAHSAKDRPGSGKKWELFSPKLTKKRELRDGVTLAKYRLYLSPKEKGRQALGGWDSTTRGAGEQNGGGTLFTTSQIKERGRKQPYQKPGPQSCKNKQQKLSNGENYSRSFHARPGKGRLV